MVCAKHDIYSTERYQGGTELQLEWVNLYYNEANYGRLVPRVVLMNLEPGTMDSATLSIHQLVENANECMVLDNEALYDIC